MKCDIAKRMKKDCHQIVYPTMIACFFQHVILIITSTIAAGMVGDMADYLLKMDKEAVMKQLPMFLCNLFIQVIVVSLIRLKLNLLLTKLGFAYDGFLMEKFIRLPLAVIQTTKAGSVMERLEEDSAEFCWNQMILYAYPGVIGIYAVWFAFTMFFEKYHIILVCFIVLFAAFPVVRSSYIGKRRAKLQKKISEYNDIRKQMEQEIFYAKDFAKVFSLNTFFVQRLKNAFDEFIKRTGMSQYCMDGWTEVLDFVCSYGMQWSTILIGAILVSTEKLTVGAVLGGYLMTEPVQKCCQYIKDWITQVHQEKKCLERLEFFYCAEEAESCAKKFDEIEMKNVSFSYSGSNEKVLENFEFHMTKDENCQITGTNGRGKTTLLSVLAGLYEPQEGSVCQGAGVMQRRRNVSFLEQDGTIFSGSIWENLFLQEEKRQDAIQILSQMGLKKEMEYKVTSNGGNLSPGEKKKILLVRALLKDAPFLFLDEPLNHLDEQGKKVLVLRLAKKKGGMLLVSHEKNDYLGNLACKSM